MNSFKHDKNDSHKSVINLKHPRSFESYLIVNTTKQHEQQVGSIQLQRLTTIGHAAIINSCGCEYTTLPISAASKYPSLDNPPSLPSLVYMLKHYFKNSTLSSCLRGSLLITQVSGYASTSGPVTYWHSMKTAQLHLFSRGIQ